MIESYMVVKTNKMTLISEAGRPIGIHLKLSKFPFSNSWWYLFIFIVVPTFPNKTPGKALDSSYIVVQ